MQVFQAIFKNIHLFSICDIEQNHESKVSDDMLLVSDYLYASNIQTVSEKIIQFGLNFYNKSKNSLTTGIKTV